MKRRKRLPKYTQKNFCHRIHVAVPYHSEGELQHKSFFLYVDMDNDRALTCTYKPRVSKVFNDDLYYGTTVDGWVETFPEQFIMSGYAI